jgi:hypothetical protein
MNPPIVLDTVILSFQPDARIYDSISHRGGRAYQAICEFIDNSIDSAINAGMANVTVALNYQTTKGNINFINIKDNAAGMTPSNLEDALKIGKDNKVGGVSGQIGRFGLGMKTSLGFLGQRWEILTATAKDNRALYINTKKSEISANNNFTLPAKYVPKVEPHGTIIQISECEDINVVTFERDLAEYLPSIFRHFLNDKFLMLTVNGKKVEPKVFKLMRDADAFQEISFKVGKTTVTGWVGLRELTSNPNYGFDLIKNRRVIQPYSKIGIGNDPALNRVVGELFLDDFVTDHQKSGFNESNPLYESMVKALNKIVKPMLEKAREFSAKSTRKSDKLLDAAIPELLRKLNEIIKNDEYLRDLIGGSKKSEKAEATTAIEGEDPKPVVEVEKKEVEAKEKVEKEKAEKKPRDNNRSAVNVGNLKTTHMVLPQGKEARRKTWLVADGSMTIVTNSDHPAFPTVGDKRQRYVMTHLMESYAHYSAVEEARREEVNDNAVASVEKYEDIFDRLHRGALSRGLLIN